MGKYIFVTGGVLSGLGKGVSAASLGRLLKSRGYSVFIQKLDPYLNVDPGTMSPYEHGETYVTKDGGETDLDLGHYERFIGTNFTKKSNFTSGKIYTEILNRERNGYFKGKTVQIIPHVTNYIEEILLNSEKETKADFIITEIGGTVGDIESQPFIYTLSNFANKYKEKSFFIHATYVPFLEASKEFKSKPTQHSIKELRQYGINPNMIILRSNNIPTIDVIKKTAFISILKEEAIIGLPNFENIYEIPLFLEKRKMAEQILDYFNLEKREPKLENWKTFVNLIKKKRKKEYVISMIGKYVKFKDAYISIIEALKIAAIYANVSIKFNWILSSDLNEDNIQKKIKNSNGALILPGFGKRGFEGKVIAAKYLRKNNIPTLGICYGLQAMTVAWARENGYPDAISTENQKNGTPIIHLIKNTKNSDSLGGSLRLGENKTKILKNTFAYEIYKSEYVLERHRHRYEINEKYKDKLEKNGFVFSGYNPENGLSEIIEYNKHPFYVGVQYHPEFNSKPLKNHLLFKKFIDILK